VTGTRSRVGTPQRMAQALTMRVARRTHCRTRALTRCTPSGRLINTVTLTYDPQGGTGEPGDQTGDAASDVTVSSTVPTRDGYTFAGWDTAADGSGTDYAGGARTHCRTRALTRCTPSGRSTPSHWRYDPQGGTGQPGDQTGDAASDVTVSSTEPTRDGYTFGLGHRSGWVGH